MGATGGHFIAFNILEFSTYAKRMLIAGVPIPIIILIRSLSTGMHLINTLIQKYYHEYSLKSKNKNESKKGWYI